MTGAPRREKARNGTAGLPKPCKRSAELWHCCTREARQKLVTEARKGDLALVASYQYLDQFYGNTERLKKALMGGTQTKVLFQLGISDAETYATFLGTGRPQSDWSASDLQNLGQRSAVLKCEGRAVGFSSVAWQPEAPSGRGTAVERESNFSYARRTQDVDTTLDRFYKAPGRSLLKAHSTARSSATGSR